MNSFLDLTGFNRLGFFELRHILFPDEEYHHQGGRYSKLDQSGRLGLCLFYLNSNLGLKHLSMIFCVSESTVLYTVNKIIKKIIFYLKDNVKSAIKFPTAAKMEYYASLVARREPTITNVIGFVDGLSLPVQCSEDPETQSLMYNGYYHDTRCNNVLAFSPEGTIFYAAINYPGSFHDSRTAYKLGETALEKLGNFSLCVDQGFPRKGHFFGKFVGPISRRTLENLSPLVKKNMIKLHNKYISLRQSAEWGMRGLQSTFCRLKTRLTSNEKKRRSILYCILLLHNFRLNYVNLNQIKSVFSKHYEQYLSVEGYDRIARYFYSED